MDYQARNLVITEKCVDEIHTLLKSPASDKRETMIQSTNGILVKVKCKNDLWRDHTEEKQPPRRRLAYLDGLRGFAALLVYILHHEGMAHDQPEREILESSFGYRNQYYFAALPGIRIFFTGGHYAVTTFFIISGYVLSSGPLRSIHARNTTKLVDTISSALVRRWFRLFIPVAVTTFLWMASWHLFGVKTMLESENNFRDELWKWYCNFKNCSFIFTGDYFNVYNYHLWSIPLEFRGSIVIYTVLIAFRRIPAGKRLCCEAVLVWYFIYVVDGWYCALFMMGMLLCDLDSLSDRDELPEILTRWTPSNNWLYPILMLVSLYLGGVPSVSDDISVLKGMPGWYWLSFLKPQAMWDFRWYYRIIAATLAMISIPRISILKNFFEGRFCQYLGQVSYGFYLIHGPVLFSLGDRLYAATGRIQSHHINTSLGWINLFPLPNWGTLGMEINIVAPHLILLPVTLWLADIVTRTIDEPSVRFSQWLMRLVFDQGEVHRKEGAEQLV